MASSLPPPSHHAPLKQKKSQLALALACVFSLFLLSALLFSKRSLEPTTSLYADISLSPSPHQTSGRSPVQSPLPPPAAPIDFAHVAKDGIRENQSPSSTPSENPSGRTGTFPPNNSVLVEEPDGRWERQKCDLYSGTWVKDEDGSYPLYPPGSCPYVDKAFTCQNNGRRDTEYLKWKWKPNGCDLPRFNASDFLERIRGKRFMLVGDSMNRNQFESILCLLREALPDKSKMFETRGYKITKGRGYFIFKFVDYDCTVEFCRSHYLVREGTRLNGQGKTRHTLSIDRIDKTSSRWKRADILVFNTGHWWSHRWASKGKDFFQEGNTVYPKLDTMEAYKRSIKTWSTWIDNNLKPHKHTVFFRGYSNAHFRGGDWDSGGTCHKETEPAFKGSIFNNYPWKMKVAEEIIRDMKFPAILLNITHLTNFRKDGHPSIYGDVRREGEHVSARKQDCSHWCLPGVPDAWNELIYANLVLK